MGLNDISIELVVRMWIAAGLILAVLPWLDPFLMRNFRLPVINDNLGYTVFLWILLAILIAPFGWFEYAKHLLRFRRPTISK